MQKIKNLISKVDTVKKLLETISKLSIQFEKELDKTGEIFNVFDIIGLRNDEVRMHSAMIQNLLDKNGSHGMGTFFIKNLLVDLDEKFKTSDKYQKFKNKNNSTFLKYINIEKSNCIKELYTGKIDGDYGGRIDLYLYDENKAIIIENKILAPEQYKQLIRYNNYNTNAPIFYLTLYGDEPNSSSYKVKGKNIDISESVFCISYCEDIITWLEKCIRHSDFKNNYVKHAIKQYLNLIKIITYRTMDSRKVKSIQEIVKKNINSIKILKSSYKNIFLPNFEDIINFFYSIDKKFNIPYEIGDKKSEIIVCESKHFIVSFYFIEKYSKNNSLKIHVTKKDFSYFKKDEIIKIKEILVSKFKFKKIENYFEI